MAKKYMIGTGLELLSKYGIKKVNLIINSRAKREVTSAGIKDTIELDEQVYHITGIRGLFSFPEQLSTTTFLNKKSIVFPELFLKINEDYTLEIFEVFTEAISIQDGNIKVNIFGSVKNKTMWDYIESSDDLFELQHYVEFGRFYNDSNGNVGTFGKVINLSKDIPILLDKELIKKYPGFMKSAVYEYAHRYDTCKTWDDILNKIQIPKFLEDVLKDYTYKNFITASSFSVLEADKYPLLIKEMIKYYCVNDEYSFRQLADMIKSLRPDHEIFKNEKNVHLVKQFMVKHKYSSNVFELLSNVYSYLKYNNIEVTNETLTAKFYNYKKSEIYLNDRYSPFYSNGFMTKKELNGGVNAIDWLATRMKEEREAEKE